MSLMDEFEQKFEGGCILLDTSVVTPHEEEPLSRILYTGIEGLEALDPAMLSHRMNRLADLTHLVQTHEIVAIPQVRSEIERHLKILNGQHAFLMSELQETVREDNTDDVHYCTDVLNILNTYNFSLHRFLKQLGNMPAISCIGQQSRYENFLDTARQFSKEFVAKSYRAKEGLRHQVHIGRELETDQHLAATLFVLAYDRPVALLTRDNGLDELTRRLYEFVVQRSAPGQSNGTDFSIPHHTINICNTNAYDQREFAQFQQEAREFLSDGV